MESSISHRSISYKEEGPFRESFAEHQSIFTYKYRPKTFPDGTPDCVCVCVGGGLKTRTVYVAPSRPKV